MSDQPDYVDDDIDDQEPLHEAARLIVTGIRDGVLSDDSAGINAISDLVKQREFLAMRTLARSLSAWIVEYPSDEDDPDWPRALLSDLIQMPPTLMTAHYAPELDERPEA